MKKHTVSRRRIIPKGKRLKPYIVHILQEATDAISEKQLEEINHPLDAVQLLLEQIPTAALKLAREEVRQERRRPIPLAVKQAVLERDKERCVVCHTKTSLHIHHYLPVAKGGKNTTENLVVLCANHHMAVHAGAIKIPRPHRVPVASEENR